MTSRERVDSAIIRKIVDHYAMLDSDIMALNAQLKQQLTVMYRTTIQKQLTLYGCQKLATGPDEQSARWIADKAKQDSEGIARTYNRELSNKVQAIYASNPRSNRYAYIRELEAWTTKRNAYKTDSISLNTMTAARKYAQDRFTEENSIQGKWVLVGPPPVCKLCLRIKALGAITYKQTQKAGNELPRHSNCPHRYGQLIPTKIPCNELTWTG